MQYKMLICNNIATVLEMQELTFRIQTKVDPFLIVSKGDVREDKIFCSLSRTLQSLIMNKAEPITEI